MRTYTTLDDALAPYGTDTSGINDYGQIVGTYYDNVGLSTASGRKLRTIP
jgi:hypothetical protein